SRLFRKHTNLSFNEYVTNLRINEAKRLMREQPGMLLKDIAEIVGYQDQHYFSRILSQLQALLLQNSINNKIL
ncbi:MAG TPA: helix-turn-helix domain-containing protein, partial [Ruminiclostridium sp.]